MRLRKVEKNKSTTNEDPTQPDPLPPADSGVDNKDGELVPQQPSLAEAVPPGDDDTINSAAKGKSFEPFPDGDNNKDGELNDETVVDPQQPSLG